MNRLLFDIGNTSLKWRWQRADFADESGWFDYHAKDLSGRLVSEMRNVIKPDGIWVASVAKKDINARLDRFLSDKWQAHAHYLASTQQALGVTNSYDKPEMLGCDRWAAMLAAYHRQQAAVLVVDCGTALTLDAIDHDGRHLGGAICPGLQTGQQALLQSTALPDSHNNEEPAQSLFTHSTLEAIQAGCIYSVVATIEYAVQQLFSNGHKPVIYLTGGDARFIKPRLAIEVVHVPALVLDGLALLADQA